MLEQEPAEGATATSHKPPDEGFVNDVHINSLSTDDIFSC